ncbi:MAG: hypothetical protein COU90_03865 [Candidatus Ryanbacteria bacterium CG10_big_fil_rev_8_21_14_0_10_43_42]|uniref:Dipeptidylpeptidase IV N-terminal domain-containing protein n=1 Tax=Candidatus Ryanbacteria bacterium CG10_big_fil_rev_8_21_14_0_10_43_42 TaxID=1974864 RepID=A0A2M8KW97_9BACT|nr:MAG: hypothetical protein COU90_03865 [Candidatus Ryanbacteria bacterium CG10_big_fil_rev_8_21_14_0_10_43_42]
MNSDKRKKIIIIGASVLGVILIGTGIFFFFRGDSQNSEQSFFGRLFGGDMPVIPGEGDGIETLPRPNTPAEGEGPRLNRVSEEPVIGATFIPDTDKIKYFKKATGHLFENTYDGLNERRASNITIPAIQKALWSPSKEYAVLSYYTDGDIRHFYTKYSGTTTAESGFLPPSLTSITMSAERDVMAYTLPVNGETAVITARPDNTAQSTILRTSIPDIILAFPGSQTLSIQTKGSAYAEGYLYTLTTPNGNLVNVLGEIYGLSSLWSPDINTVLYFSTNQNGNSPSLNLYSKNTGVVRTLSMTTLPEKCVWSSREEEHILYCGIPDKLPRTTLPDAWWQGTVSFSDSIWRINLDTNEQIKLIDTSELNVDAVHLFTSGDASHLFFTNKKDGSLWSYRLTGL